MATASYGSQGSSGGGGGGGGGGGLGVQSVATYADLAALASASLTDGTLAYVQSTLEYFVLVTSGAATRTNVRVAASGFAGHQWSRIIKRNVQWEVQATWVIDPTNSTGLASDDNTGVDATHPLLTWQECSMRLWTAEIGQATTIAALGDQQVGDTPVFSYFLRPGGGTMSMTGTPTIVYSSTVTGYVAAAFGTTAADDNEFSDTAVPGGTFTAAGALAKGVLLRRTNGTVIYAPVLKDLGSTTCRIGQPQNPASTSAAVAFAIGDSYQLLRLPKMLSLRVNDQSLINNAPTKLTTFEFSVAQGLAPGAVTLTQCYISGGFRGTGAITCSGCCVDTGGPPPQAIGQNLSFSMCSFKGTGATTYSFSNAAINTEGSVLSLQGCQVVMASGVWNAGQFAVYDNTNAGAFPAPVGCDTGGRFHFLGPISGKGCTHKLVCARQSTQIVTALPLAAGSFYTAATTTDVTPIQAGSTASAVAIPLDANGNGVYQTA